MLKTTGQWKCFLCGKRGTDGKTGFMRHYDVYHLEGDA